MAFIIWSIVAFLFIIISITTRGKDYPVGFYTGVKAPDIKDYKAYNKDVANLWLLFAVLFEIFGLPVLFCEQNDPRIIITIIGVVALIIGLVIAYNKIEMKYR